ncbi:hypothetical protein MAR621_03119 [Maribacter dokdonensis]|uniref:hypothetical protein n=1 Tax=Maribacter dokdonensis TaxID=320912 RepID=UPI001B281AFE|nr:hypothetical protein [Maribacter dokdonensis]CAG2532925.1 hypothetical protein MAR621_03119 [Maribacter dokdonensis]
MKIREVIEKIVKDTVVMTVQKGEVTKVSGESCTVKSDHDNRVYYEVSFNALVQNKSNKVLVTPKLNSKVVIGVFPNGKDAVLLSYSEVEKVFLKIETTEFEAAADGYSIKRNNEDLKTVLNDYIDEVNKIIVVNGTTINVAATTAIKERLNKILK